MAKYNSLLNVLELSVIEFLGTEGYQFMTIEQESIDGKYIVNVAYTNSPKGLVLCSFNIKSFSSEEYLIFIDEMCEKDIGSLRDYYIKEVEWNTPLPYPVSSWDK